MIELSEEFAARVQKELGWSKSRVYLTLSNQTNIELVLEALEEKQNKEEEVPKEL